MWLVQTIYLSRFILDTLFLSVCFFRYLRFLLLWFAEAEAGDLALFEGEAGEEEEDADDGHDQTTNGAGCEREPESFLVFTYHEGDEAQNGRYNCQEDGQYLRVPSFDVGMERRHEWFADTYLVELVEHIDTGIHSNTAQQYERSETTLVEVEFKPIEGQEDSDIRNRDDEDNSQRLPERVEQNTGREEDNRDDNKQKGILLVIFLTPTP